MGTILLIGLALALLGAFVCLFVQLSRLQRTRHALRQAVRKTSTTHRPNDIPHHAKSAPSFAWAEEETITLEIEAEVALIRQLQERIAMVEVESVGSRAPNRATPIDTMIANGLAEAKANSDRLNRFALAA